MHTWKPSSENKTQITVDDVIKEKASRLKPSAFTDIADAELFAELNANDVIFVGSSEHGTWYSWDGVKWASDNHSVEKKAISFATKMLQEATEVKEIAELKLKYILDAGFSAHSEKVSLCKEELKSAKEFFNHARRLNSATGQRHMLKIAASLLSKNPAELDAFWNELNTPSGIVDLTTGRILPHSDPSARTHFHTKCTLAGPSKQDNSEWWTFLDTVCNGDSSMIGSLQQIAGLAAYGKVFEEGLFIACGDGRNGKSTFINALAAVFGTYAGMIDIDTITSNAGNTGPIIAMMRGMRLVIAGELEEGRRMSASVVKKICSTDSITANPKYKDPLIFRPSHTLILFSNHLPRIGSTDTGTWRRINVLPFTAKITGENSVANYTDALVQRCADAIIQWIIDGARIVARNNYKLTMCDAIADATDIYRDREDWVTIFISECCVKRDGTRLAAQQLYDAYREHAMHNGEYVRRMNEFTPALKLAGYRQVNYNGRKYWVDISLS